MLLITVIAVFCCILLLFVLLYEQVVELTAQNVEKVYNRGEGIDGLEQKAGEFLMNALLCTGISGARLSYW